ncbi:MAG: 4-hydroxyphenyl-beta-ketoacyl-CoA hydrolase [Dehalococcoidia bacterium]|jgi:predicted TIM-barrel fold metal-dependent hydrolase|nr:4-hydroxyphenyl-beta-ketoacyl-CoA hydrolase [Dehalococcoidia bacterium]|tara:strand:+ start:2221 stop:3060 length:840 start_codon:yes stop_codon:yes gene_type:complete
MIAIDMHVHVPRNPNFPDVEVEQSLKNYFKPTDVPKDADDMAAKYKVWDMLAVIFSVDTQTATGDVPDGNEYVANIVKKYPEQFIGFATVDPWMGKSALQELENSVKNLGLKGLKLHPTHQAFQPNDTLFYPLYDACAQLGVPVLFHSGFAACGVGMPGGGGFKLKYSAPIPGIDDIAADFPSLTIIMAHPAWPWIEEQIAVALHKPNVYLDLSGWAPRFIPQALIRETNTRLKEKVLFGSDFPYLPPDKWLREFDALEIREGIREKVLLENAKKVLKL